jgi:hypothetical protein
MTHWRTSRSDFRGRVEHLTGSPSGSKYALPENLLSPRLTFELSEISEPSLDEFELGSGLRLFLILLAPSLIVLVSVVGYMAFVS